MSQELATREEPSIALMMQTMVERGITEANVAAMTQLMALHERMEARNAEKAFNAAFVKLQTELPTIVADSVIPNRGKYARFEDVMRQIQPMLTSNGFSLSFTQSFDQTRIIETCHLKHVAGHSQSNSFGVRLGGKADSPTQDDCKASTTAKRNALLNALNIVIRQDVMQNEDDDASLIGETISQQEAHDLRSRIRKVKGDEDAFLGLAQVTKYEDIPRSRLPDLETMLRRKEAKAAKAHPVDQPDPVTGEFPLA